VDASATIRLPAHPGNNYKEEPPVLMPATARSETEASDEVLMAQLGEGNREALAILFRRYARLVRAIAYRSVRDASEADDLVQDVFLLVHRDAKAFDGAKGAASSWIFQIAHRRAISRHRYLSSRHFYQQVNLDNLAEEPQAATIQHGNPIEDMFGEVRFQPRSCGSLPKPTRNLATAFC
jgi:RNA polymerase sigma factor (sigma-70 family)